MVFFLGPGLELLSHLKCKHDSSATSFQTVSFLSALASELPNTQGFFLNKENPPIRLALGESSSTSVLKFFTTISLRKMPHYIIIIIVENKHMIHLAEERYCELVNENDRMQSPVNFKCLPI